VPRFPAAAGAFFIHGSHQAVAAVKALIAHFCEKGWFRDCDQEGASRAFLSMLRRNLFQEIALGCGSEPDERDLESRTRSVVEVFLRGPNSFVKLFGSHKAADNERWAKLPVKKCSTRHPQTIA